MVRHNAHLARRVQYSEHEFGGHLSRTGVADAGIISAGGGAVVLPLKKNPILSSKPRLFVAGCCPEQLRGKERFDLARLGRRCR
jgi:hypothetical protein